MSRTVFPRDLYVTSLILGEADIIHRTLGVFSMEEMDVSEEVFMVDSDLEYLAESRKLVQQPGLCHLVEEIGKWNG